MLSLRYLSLHDRNGNADSKSKYTAFTCKNTKVYRRRQLNKFQAESTQEDQQTLTKTKGKNMAVNTQTQGNQKITYRRTQLKLINTLTSGN